MLREFNTREINYIENLYILKPVGSVIRFQLFAKE